MWFKQELFDLIDKSESLSDNDRKYWKQIYSKMKDEHRQTLFLILYTEKQRLAELEERYRDDLLELMQKNELKSTN